MNVINVIFIEQAVFFSYGFIKQCCGQELFYSNIFKSLQKNLLILSPDSRNDLIEYNPNDIYVIGGIVEKAAKTRHTLDYARHNEIRHARFPMKRVLG